MTPTLNKARQNIWLLDSEMVKTSNPVRVVEDPYVESDIRNLLIAINPYKPISREVSKDTPNSYTTLVNAKKAARNILQDVISEAQTSLINLRQVEYKKITHISLQKTNLMFNLISLL